MSEEFQISEKRLLWLTGLVMLGLTAGSLTFGDWRVTTGVMLGGVLSFLNLWWLKISLKSILSHAAETGDERFNSAFYILRYGFIIAVVGLAATLKLVTVAATLIGLLSFAFAILLEAIIHIYFIIVNREED